MSTHVHELAKTLGLSSKELVKKLQGLKIDVKSHMSVVPEGTIQLLKREAGKPLDSARGALRQAQDHSKDREQRRTGSRGGERVEPKTTSAKTPKKEKVTLPVKEVVSSPKPPVKPVFVLPKEAEPVKQVSAPKPGKIPLPPPVQKQPEVKEPEKPKVLQAVQLRYPVSVKDLSVKISVKPSELIKALIRRKVFVTINQTLEETMVVELANEFGFKPEKIPTIEEALILEHEEKDGKNLKPRAPIVTLMGHVDHGKTSLLDAIRQSDVAAGEAGGITQHIGAYEVALGKGHVTFLDTPGHEAFTAMRARGANITDVVVLVVAADDGMMPQTEEAIDHAKAAGVPIVVAINKCDLPGANLDRVKKQLTEKELVPEEWGGKTIMVPVSAKTKQGIPKLLEMLLLEAELLELRANPSKRAKGTVIESELSKGKGPVATVLIQDGTLKVGDIVVCGLHCGKVRAMIDDKGRRIDDATPSRPVEIMGLSGVPQAGDRFYVVQDEKTARQIATERKEVQGIGPAGPSRHLTLEDLHNRIQEGKLKEVKFILKADVQGSLGALKGELAKIESKDVKLVILHTGLGDINESDIMLAAASDAVVLGFHVGELPRAEAVARKEGVEVKQYDIIYEAVSEIRLAMEGLLEPVTKETFLGRAEIKQVFKISKIGNIAGCLAVKGKLIRAGNPVARVVRNKEIVFEGKLAALKRFKEDVKEVSEGQECGISLENFKDFQTGDWIELYQLEKVAQKLGAPLK